MSAKEWCTAKQTGTHLEALSVSDSKTEHARKEEAKIHGIMIEKQVSKIRHMTVQKITYTCTPLRVQAQTLTRSLSSL
jgi:hypothetical protein